MGYRRNELARSMASGRTNTIGPLIQHSMSEFTSRMTVSILDESREYDYSVRVIDMHHDETDRRAIESCTEMRLTGLIGAQLSEKAVSMLRIEAESASIRLAYLDCAGVQQSEIHMLSDDIGGMTEGVNHLTGLGHTRIAMINGIWNTEAVLLREEGFRKAMLERKLPLSEDTIQHTTYDASEMEDVVKGYFSDPQTATMAIICAGDGLAMTLIPILRRRELNVPYDISVVGFADLNMARFYDPALTTIAQPFESMGRSTLRLLRDRIEGKGSESGGETLLPTTLTLRQSTAPVSIRRK